ncbi:SufE family protein [Pontimonas sp.]|nr:SufE family protein [Pontimonas sp.]
MPDTSLPPALTDIREDFLALSVPDRLQLLLEFSDSLPVVPDELVDPDAWERVEECQSPVFITVETTPEEVMVYATAPAEAPTTRGFASILVQGLHGMTPQQVLAVPPDFPLQLGLQNAVSMLRLRGMSGMLWRIKRQVEEGMAKASHG